MLLCVHLRSATYRAARLNSREPFCRIDHHRSVAESVSMHHLSDPTARAAALCIKPTTDTFGSSDFMVGFGDRFSRKLFSRASLSC